MRIIHGAALAFAGWLLMLACSSSSEGSAAGIESVTDWTCCALGETTGSCACYQNTEHTQHGCSNSVSSCSVADGGVGCCVATGTSDGWLCECWPAGSDCSAELASGAKSVPNCPP